MRWPLLTFFCLSLLLSSPSLLRIPRLLPFLKEDVRRSAPKALDALRRQGIWLVNVDILQITQSDKEICFLWEHRYTRRTGKDSAEALITCLPP